MSPQDKIKNIEYKIEILNIELKQVEGLVEILPDLHIYEERYCDIYVSNSLEPTNVDFGYCGRDYLDSINVRFYSIVNNTKVYKYRTAFYLGKKFEGNIIEDPNWEKNFKNYYIPQKLIDICRKYVNEYTEEEFLDE